MRASKLKERQFSQWNVGTIFRAEHVRNLKIFARKYSAQAFVQGKVLTRRLPTL